MNIDVWQAVLAVAVASAAAGFGSRWWYQRQLVALQRQHDKLDTNHQSTVRMMSQARKQTEDLQRLVAEYRRKCTALELERRRAKLAVAAALDESLSPMALGAIQVPGNWADTQPLER